MKGCVDNSRIVALMEDLNFLHRKKISNFSNFHYSDLEIHYKYLGNSKEIPGFSYKRLRENVRETYFILRLLLKGNFLFKQKLILNLCIHIAYKLFTTDSFVVHIFFNLSFSVTSPWPLIKMLNAVHADFVLAKTSESIWIIR